MFDGLRSLRRVRQIVEARLLGTITQVLTSERVVALTFDDGPDREFTPRVLDVLGQYGAKGTFFVVGRQAKRYPEIINRIVKDGHAIGNHTWDHPSLPVLSMAERRHQVEDCSEVVPHRTTLLRPPYGHMDICSRAQLTFLGYKVIGWNVAAKDWDGDDAETLAGRVMDGIRPGSIVLFHDALYMFTDPKSTERTPTVEAVRLVLEQLCGKYKFVTVPELLKLGKEQKSGWFTQPNPLWLNQLRRRIEPNEA